MVLACLTGLFKFFGRGRSELSKTLAGKPPVAPFSTVSQELSGPGMSESRRREHFRMGGDASVRPNPDVSPQRSRRALRSFH